MTNSKSLEKAEHYEAVPTTLPLSVPICDLADSTQDEHEHSTFDSTTDATEDSSLLASSRITSTSKKSDPNRSDANPKGTRKKKKKRKKVLLCEETGCDSNIVVNEDTPTTLDSVSCSPQTTIPSSRKSDDSLDTKSRTTTRKEKKSGKPATYVDQPIFTPSSVTTCSTDIESPSVSKCQTNVLVLASGCSSCSPSVRKSVSPSTKKKTKQVDPKMRVLRKRKDKKMNHKTGDATDGTTPETQQGQGDRIIESCVLPGAVQVNRVHHADLNDSGGGHDVVESSDSHSDNLTGLIVAAELAPDEEDVATRLADRLERQIKEVETRLMTHHRTPVLAEAIVAKTSTEIRCWQRGIWAFLCCFVVLIIGTTLLVVLIKNQDDDPSASPTLQTSLSPNSQGTFRPTLPTTLSPTVNVKVQLLQELEPWIVRSESDLVPFEDPTSPQSLALEWLSTDPINLATNRSTSVVLERYVLALVYFSMNGPSWRFQGLQYMSEAATCDWNNGLLLNDDNALGIYCDGRSPVRHIIFNQASLSGTIPWEVSLLSDLVYLQFSYNTLRGTIPTEVSELRNLERLMVGSNDLTGPLPINLPSSLQYISFANNVFTGSIPSGWGDQLSNLLLLYLDENDLSGPLPSELGQVTTIQVFTIDFNAFTGSLPSEFGKLTAMDRLWMNDNDLTGTIPMELSQMTTMRYASFHNNFFTGSVNDIFCVSREWNVLNTDCLMDGNGLVEIECNCCTGCCSSPDGYCEGV